MKINLLPFLLLSALYLAPRAPLKADEASRADYNKDAAKKNEAALAPADNTKKNLRDRLDATLTPEDQVESESDRKIIQEIRKEIVADKSLSMNAKNIKIISLGGKVTLRGPVKNMREKEAIVILPKGVAGVSIVNDKLETTTKDGN